MHQFGGVSRRLANRGPGKAQLILHFVHLVPRRIAQDNVLPVFREGGGAIRSHRPDGVGEIELGLQGSGVLRHHDEAARRDVRRGQHEVQVASIRERPASEIHRVRAGVVQFDELHRLRLHIRIIVNFVDDDGRGQRKDQASRAAQEGKKSAHEFYKLDQENAIRIHVIGPKTRRWSAKYPDRARFSRKRLLPWLARQFRCVDLRLRIRPVPEMLALSARPGAKGGVLRITGGIALHLGSGGRIFLRSDDPGIPVDDTCFQRSAVGTVEAPPLPIPAQQPDQNLMTTGICRTRRWIFSCPPFSCRNPARVCVAARCLDPSFQTSGPRDTAGEGPSALSPQSVAVTGRKARIKSGGFSPPFRMEQRVPGREQR